VRQLPRPTLLTASVVQPRLFGFTSAAVTKLLCHVIASVSGSICLHTYSGTVAVLTTMGNCRPTIAFA
jgi:hypothetical protein